MEPNPGPPPGPPPLLDDSDDDMDVAADEVEYMDDGTANASGNAQSGADLSVVETTNVTGAASLWEHLARTEAWVVLAQEVKITDVERATKRAWQLGWRSLWTPSRKTDEGGLSAGTAILVRRQLALWAPAGGHRIVPHRATAAFVGGAGLPPYLAISAYFRCSEGPSTANLGMLAAIGDEVAAEGRPFILGADFNMSPESVLGTGAAAAAMGARIIA